MLRFCPFYSSSDGNALFVSSDKAKILVDVGVTYKKLIEALDGINESISNIDAIFITHSHSDHCKALKQITKNHNIPLYATEGTISNLDIFPTFHNINKIVPDNDIILNDLIISSFKTPHDTDMSCGYIIKDDVKMITIATDLRTY